MSDLVALLFTFWRSEVKFLRVFSVFSNAVSIDALTATWVRPEMNMFLFLNACLFYADKVFKNNFNCTLHGYVPCKNHITQVWATTYELNLPMQLIRLITKAVLAPCWSVLIATDLQHGSKWCPQVGRLLLVVPQVWIRVHQQAKFSICLSDKSQSQDHNWNHLIPEIKTDKNCFWNSKYVVKNATDSDLI